MYPAMYMRHCDPCKPKLRARRDCAVILGNGCLMPYMKMAHAYVPYQFFAGTFSPDVSLQKGTAFPDLYQPYKKCCKEGRYY